MRLPKNLRRHKRMLPAVVILIITGVILSTMPEEVYASPVADPGGFIRQADDEQNHVAAPVSGVASGPSASPSLSPSPTPEITPTAVPSPDITPSASPEAAPTTAPVTTPAATLTPADPPSPTPAVLPTPLPDGMLINQDDARYVVVGENEIGYAGSTGDSVPELTIPDTILQDGIEYRVTKVLQSAFINNSRLETVTLGKYIQTIESCAFKNCVSLISVISSPALRTIGKEAFFNCKNLKSMRLSNAIRKICNRAFMKCVKLKTFYMGSSNKAAGPPLPKYDTINITIGSEVFSSCQNLSRVVINCQVRVIGNSAFYNCTKLTSILVYSKVLKTVGNSALKGVHNCRISVLKVRLKKYKKLFKNKGQGKKVVVAKL